MDGTLVNRVNTYVEGGRWVGVKTCDSDKSADSMSGTTAKTKYNLIVLIVIGSSGISAFNVLLLLN